MARRAGALSRGPPGPAHAPVGDEGLGLRLAWTTLGLGRRDGRGRQSVLARALPELQDHVPVPRGQLRAGRRRAGALHRRRVSVVHPRHSPHGGGIAPHEPGLPPSSDPGHAMTASLLSTLLSNARLRRSTAVGWMDRDRTRGEAFQPSFSLEDVMRAPGDPLAYRNSPAHPAHILFTSGSTGTPKGVVIPHRNVIHFVEWARRYFNLGPTDRVSGHPPLHFDLSTFDVFGTFASGAQLHLVPP